MVAIKVIQGDLFDRLDIDRPVFIFRRALNSALYFTEEAEALRAGIDHWTSMMSCYAKGTAGYVGSKTSLAQFQAALNYLDNPTT